MATTVILIRHGQTNANITGFYMGWDEGDLNEAGYTQARHLASRLAALPLASLYTSPLKRAHTTAAILAESHNLRPEVLDDLIEIRLGDWQGKHMDEIKRRWPELWRQSRIDPSGLTLPNGESYTHVTERAVRAFERAVKANYDRHLVIVTHDSIIRMIVAYVLGVSNSIYRRLTIDNASLSVVEAVNDQFRLIKLNDAVHLGNNALQT